MKKPKSFIIVDFMFYVIVRILFADGVRQEPVLCSFDGFLIKRTVVGFPSILSTELFRE